MISGLGFHLTGKSCEFIMLQVENSHAHFRENVLFYDFSRSGFICSR